MLEPDLGVNEVMANLSSKSGLITNHSRLGCALNILAGGRRIEAMRTQLMIITEMGVLDDYKVLIRI